MFANSASVPYSHSQATRQVSKLLSGRHRGLIALADFDDSTNVRGKAELRPKNGLSKQPFPDRFDSPASRAEIDFLRHMQRAVQAEKIGHWAFVTGRDRYALRECLDYNLEKGEVPVYLPAATDFGIVHVDFDANNHHGTADLLLINPDTHHIHPVALDSVRAQDLTHLGEQFPTSSEFYLHAKRFSEILGIFDGLARSIGHQGKIDDYPVERVIWKDVMWAAGLGSEDSEQRDHVLDALNRYLGATGTSNYFHLMPGKKWIDVMFDPDHHNKGIGTRYIIERVCEGRNLEPSQCTPLAIGDSSPDVPMFEAALQHGQAHGPPVIIVQMGATHGTEARCTFNWEVQELSAKYSDVEHVVVKFDAHPEKSVPECRRFLTEILNVAESARISR